MKVTKIILALAFVFGANVVHAAESAACVAGAQAIRDGKDQKQVKVAADQATAKPASQPASAPKDAAAAPEGL